GRVATIFDGDDRPPSPWPGAQIDDRLGEDEPLDPARRQPQHDLAALHEHAELAHDRPPFRQRGTCSSSRRATVSALNGLVTNELAPHSRARCWCLALERLDTTTSGSSRSAGLVRTSRMSS